MEICLHVLFNANIDKERDMKNKYKYRTTKLLTNEPPCILDKNTDLYETRLFVENNNNLIDEGGLRKQDYFKQSKSNLPLVSVVTVVYNGEKYLEDTIKSVISQSYDNVEYIIVDGGSKDDTLEIIKKYDDVIDYWASEPDNGIYDAMNKAIQLCSGEIIKIVNADDLLTDESISMAIDVYLEVQNKGEFFISSYLDIIDQDGKVVALWSDKPFTKYFPVFNHPAWYVPAKIYKKYGLYSLNYPISADYEYFARLLSHNVKIYMHKKPLAKFRKGGASSGFSGVKQVFHINRKYFSLARAIYVFIYHGSLKVGGKIKKMLLE